MLEPDPPATSSLSSARPKIRADERLDEVDGLQPVEPGPALPPDDDAVLQLERLGGDAVAGHPPGERRAAARRRGRRRRAAIAPAPSHGMPSPVHPARSPVACRTAFCPVSCRTTTSRTAMICHDRTAGVSGWTRCQAPSAMPAAGTGGAAAGRRVTGPPAAPRRARPAGRAAGRPPAGRGRGCRRRCAREAVCSCTLASPNIAVDGAGVHVDVLHPAVRHDDDRRAT